MKTRNEKAAEPKAFNAKARSGRTALLLLSTNQQTTTTMSQMRRGEKMRASPVPGPGHGLGPGSGPVYWPLLRLQRAGGGWLHWGAAAAAAAKFKVNAEK